MGAVHHAIAPSVYKKLDYSIEKDFTLEDPGALTRPVTLGPAAAV